MEEYNVDEVIKNIFSHDDPDWKPSDKIQLIVKELDRCKGDLKTFINTSDITIEGILKDSDELCAESNLLVDDLKKCKNEIEVETMANIVKSIDNYEHLSKELKSVTFAEKIINDVIKCGTLVTAFHAGQEAESYTQSVQSVWDLVQILNQPSEHFHNLDISCKTRGKAQIILDNLIQHLYNDWDQLLSLSPRYGQKQTVVTLQIKLRESPTCFDIVNALRICKELEGKVIEFATSLMKNVLRPILHNDCSLVTDVEDTIILTFTHKHNYKPPYNEVMSKLTTVFRYLAHNMNKNFGNGQSVFKMVGEKICEDFCEKIQRECFVYTIPKNIANLHQYDEVTNEIADFQKYLETEKFFPPHKKLSILEYVENIEEHFAEQAAGALLDTARTIMMKDLSISMSIGVTVTNMENQEDRFNRTFNDIEAAALTSFDINIPQSLFYFPRCMISKSAQELMDHLYTIMEQAILCQDMVCKKMYCVVRRIFELYDAIVPYHHEKYLQTIPQYVALFHNNCMYLAHNMLTFGDKWMNALVDREVDYPISFIDLVQKLRDLGQRHLTMHMQQQRKQILDNIRSSDLNCIVSKDVLGDNAETAIRQCLRQLQLLKNVWIGVFPLNVFTRLMATLVNMFTEELIHRVCTVEDIPAEMATQLSDMYGLVVMKVPHLFPDPGEIRLFVKSWSKLEELIFILRGTLKDIETHWQDGSGPLTVNFKAEELRGLIKALFQNTQLRANLLAKIK